jgi:hypothetical protein
LEEDAQKIETQKTKQGEVALERGRLLRASMESKTLASVIIILFFLYPSLTEVFFSVLWCKPMEGNNYMIKDLEELCWTGTHIYMTGFASFCIIGYCLGIPLMAVVLLLRRRNKLKTQNTL